MRIHAFLIAGLAFGVFGNVTAQISSVTVPGQPISCMDMQTRRPARCPDNTLVFEEGRGLVEQAYHKKDFARLDELFKQWSTGKDRFPDGSWKLSTFGNGLGGLFEMWDQWDADLRTIRSWQEQRPDSFAAKYAEAVYWRSYAWKARGGGTADTVAKEAWELFGERLGKAGEILEKIKDGATRYPSWYPSRIGLAIDQGTSDAAVRKLFLEGVQRFPEYHDIYYQAARAYSPKWGGNPRAYENFARESAKLAAAFEGPGMYARVYSVVDTQRDLPFNPERSPYPDWDRLKAGYQELMRRYPSSTTNLNRFASVTCRSDDSELYRDLRTRLGPYANDSDFKLVSLDACDRRHSWQKPQ